MSYEHAGQSADRQHTATARAIAEGGAECSQQAVNTKLLQTVFRRKHFEPLRSDFEVRYGMPFPEEFREYLTNVNGMLQVEDRIVIARLAFWQLNRIRAVDDECAASKGTVATFDEVESFFAFADYLQRSWAYAVALGTERRGAILQFGPRSPRIVAGSFADFVEAYINDAEQRYIPQSSAF